MEFANYTQKKHNDKALPSFFQHQVYQLHDVGHVHLTVAVQVGCGRNTEQPLPVPKKKFCNNSYKLLT